MKRYAAMLFSLVYIVVLTGCNNSPAISNHEPVPIFTEPPTLTVNTLDSSIEALRGTTSWFYDNGDGTQTGIESDSMHPLDSNSKEYMPTLLITLTPNSSKNPLEAVLQFNVTPDEVSVHCWSDEHWGNTSAQSEDILINDSTIELKDGRYIYEVIAHWNNSEKYGGTAYYSFYATEKINANVIPDGAENNTFTDILGLNGYYVKIEETPPGFMIWRYFAELDGKTQCIAEVFGYTVSEPEVYSKDIDGDGIKELICNCTYGTGAKRVYIYRNNNGVIEQGTLVYDTNNSSIFPNLNNWGSNAIQEMYDPDNDTFVISYSTETGTEQTVFQDKNIINFQPFSPDVEN